MTEKTVDKIEEHPKHRSLIFEDIGSNQENLSLYIYDRKNPKNTEGSYKIPLYTAQAQEIGVDVADIELVHISPLIFDTKDENLDYISPLPEGYIYIFVDGYLWRELKVIVDEKGNRTFSDVNLAFQKGFLVWKTRKNKEYAKQGQRSATCEQLKSIIVPNKVRGQQCQVEIAFSEVQWSWVQILKLGGMNPEDPRLNQGDALSNEERLCPDTTVAAQARRKRMQLLDNLSDFERGFTNQGIIKNEPRVNINISHFASDKLAPVVLTNGLHVTRNHIDAILKIQGEIARILHDIKGVKAGEQGEEIVVDSVKKANFELAEKMINRFYQMNDSIIDGDIKISGDAQANTLQVEQLKFANKVKAWRTNGIDQIKLKKYLKYDDLLALSEEIKAQQLILVELIDQDLDIVKLRHCVEDFAYHKNVNYASGIDVIKDIALALKIHPAHQYATIILNKDDWDSLTTNVTTSSALLKLVGEHPDETPHRIADLFFGKPKEAATEDKPASIELDPEDHQDPFNPKFSLERMQMVADDESFDDTDREATEQIGRRFFQALMGMTTNFLDLSLIASANQGQAQKPAAYHQQIKSEQADGQKTQRHLDKELKENAKQKTQLEARLKQAQQSLDEKTKGLSKKDVEYQKQHNLAKPEIDKLKAELGSIDSKFSKAQKSLRNIDNKLAHIEVEIKNLGSAHLSKNKGLMAAIRIINQLENGQFTTLEMTAQDYHNGKYAEGFIALNARARAEIAVELSKEIRDVVRGANNSRTNLVTANGAIVDTVEDIMHLRSKVHRLIELTNQAQAVMAGEGAAQLKLHVVALKESEKALQLRTTSLTHEIAEFEQGKVKLTNDIAQNSLANEKLKNLAKETEKLANQKFLSNVTVDTLTKANVGVLGAVAIFEVINLTRSFEAAAKNLNGKTAYYVLTAGIDFAAVVMTLVRESYVMRHGHPSREQLSLLIQGKPNIPAQVVTWFKLTRIMYGTTIAASVFSAATSFYEAYKAIQRGDNDAAFGLATMSLGFAMTAVGDSKILYRLLFRGVISGSRLGWVGFVIVLVGVVIYYYFVDEDIERWLKVNPWGKNAFCNDNSKSWEHRPDYAYHDLAQKLMAPQVHGDNVEKQAPMYHAVFPRPVIAASYESYTDAYFTLSCPTNTSPDYINVELAVKSRGRSKGSGDNSAEYQNIILGSAVGQGQQWLQQFWDNVIITSMSGGQGLRIDLNQYICAPLFKQFNTTRLTFRLRVKTYPKGKGRPVSDVFTDNEFKLPISERDDDGNFEDEIDWQSTEVNLSLLSIKVKKELGLA